MENKLYQITLRKGTEIVYNDNLPFTRVEPNNDDIICLFKLLRPNFKFDTIEWKFVRLLLEKEL